MAEYREGFVPGNQANVFVANHDTERVRLVKSSQMKCANSMKCIEWELLDHEFLFKHVYPRISLLTCPSIWNANHHIKLFFH